jgi:hypothetical protein
VVTAKDLDAATLHSRMHAEVSANGTVVVGRYEVGAGRAYPNVHQIYCTEWYV